jgi:hypothetical protein
MALTMRKQAAEIIAEMRAAEMTAAQARAAEARPAEQRDNEASGGTGALSKRKGRMIMKKKIERKIKQGLCESAKEESQVATKGAFKGVKTSDEEAPAAELTENSLSTTGTFTRGLHGAELTDNSYSSTGSFTRGSPWAQLTDNSYSSAGSVTRGSPGLMMLSSHLQSSYLLQSSERHCVVGQPDWKSQQTTRNGNDEAPPAPPDPEHIPGTRLSL